MEWAAPPLHKVFFSQSSKMQNVWTSARLPELKLPFNGFRCDVHVIWSLHLRSVSQIWPWQLEYSYMQHTLHSFLMPCFLQCDIPSTPRERDANRSVPAESRKLKLHVCHFINKNLVSSERKSHNKQEQDMTRCMNVHHSFQKLLQALF